jgi:hypothetical protein
MSGWTEYVIAETNEAAAIANENNPKRRWPGFEGYKFFGPILLAPLYEVLGKTPATYQDFTDLGLGSHGWVYEMPPQMLSALRKLELDSLGSIAEVWGKKLREMTERYSAHELETLLRQIRDLADRAAEAHESVLLWHSTSC